LTIRAWALHDETVRRHQERIDARRLKYLQELSQAFTEKKTDAVILSRIFYAVFIGAQHMMPPIEGRELQQLYKYLQQLYRED
jgi:hypothetical protein